MEYLQIIWMTLVSLCFCGSAVLAVDPYYIPKAKIISSRTHTNPGDPKFKASVKRCCKIGEKIARKQLVCTADTKYMQRLTNHVFRTKLKFDLGSEQTRALAFKVSKCSLRYGKNFEKCCAYKASYYSAKRKCKRLTDKAARIKCRRQNAMTSRLRHKGIL